uniref:Ubiquitin-like protease family profile domain-containing protein n=1 Tax=Chenopodium quinoa TaxID=63459 RepID=A0A803N2J1_CHEQI
MTLEQRRDFPLIKVWTNDLIKDIIDLEMRLGFGLGILLDRVQPPIVVDIPIPQHLLGMNQELVVVPTQPEMRQQQEEEQLPGSNEYNQMLQEVTERIANDFVSLTNILKLGERFHTTPLVDGNTMYNLTAMWSKCAGVNLPNVIQHTQDQHAVGASILSQDTDFFESDWFGDMIDDVVKNVMMASMQDNPSTYVSPIHPLIFSQELTPPHAHDHVNDLLVDLDLPIGVDNTKLSERNKEEDDDALEKEDVGADELESEKSVGQVATDGIRLDKFIESIEFWLIDCKMESVQGYQLFFFPVYAHDHFYVMVINTKSKCVEILDNRPLVQGVTFEEKYHDFPEKLRDAFAMYLNKYEIKIGEKMPTCTVKLVEMPWRTLSNSIDCGIYTMRHMETYFGKRRWNCGLRADNFDALKSLRMRYTYELIVDDLNKYKADVSVKARKYYSAISKN